MDLSRAKHAFITGGASGIGLGIADALARRGLLVTIADIDAAAMATVVASRAAGFRGQALELTIVLLIVIELVLAVMKVLH